MHRPADLIYRYDASWHGFLCCVFESFRCKELPCAILPLDCPSMSLFPEKEISTDSALAQRVAASFPKKLGKSAHRILSTAFLIGQENKEHTLLSFLILAYQTGPPVFSMLGHPLVSAVHQMQRQVRMEAHQFTGFLRFQDYGEFLGASIQPKHQVLPLLARHFSQRFPGEDFVIYDQTHCTVLFQKQKKLEYAVLEQPPQFPSVSRQEVQWQQLWKQFYNTISIPERENLDLRRNHCPKRFWSNMTEFQ